VNRPMISFGVIADCQFADADDLDMISSDQRHRHHSRYRTSIVRLRSAVETFNLHDLDFIVHLGDLIDRRLDDADRLQPIIDTAEAAWWHVLGNHDFSGSEGAVDKVLRKYGLDRGYYSKRLGGYRFITLDTNELGTLKHAPGSPEWTAGQALLDSMRDAGKVNGAPWNGGVGAPQLAWLDEELRQAEGAGERVIVFAHHPVFPSGPSNALNDVDMLDMLDSHGNVAAFINGHNHFGAVGVRRGIPYLTIPGILESDTDAHGIIDIFQDAIRIRGYGRVQDMEFEIT